ncbi:MAG: electron transport complex subunit RsxC, partial [Desulfobulbaceae bacterium]|nr:electron transport complex subunit RsxC [Desulfobulbaceae bacterium]
HASVSGTVKGIGFSAHPLSVKAPSILIETDPDAAPKNYSALPWEDLPSQQLLEKIKAAGIVGIGGAGFPTPCKALPPS